MLGCSSKTEESWSLTFRPSSIHVLFTSLARAEFEWIRLSVLYFSSAVNNNSLPATFAYVLPASCRRWSSLTRLYGATTRPLSEEPAVSPSTYQAVTLDVISVPPRHRQTRLSPGPAVARGGETVRRERRASQYRGSRGPPCGGRRRQRVPSARLFQPMTLRPESVKTQRLLGL